VHPLSGARKIALYVLAWVPIAYALGALLAAQSHSQSHTTLSALTAIPLCFFYAVICLSAWYPCRALPAGREPLERILLTHLASAAVAAAMGAGLAAVFFAVLPLTGSITPALPAVFAVGFVLYLLAVASWYVVLSVEAARLAEAREAEAHLLAGKAELRALKAQINPHFLYNSLNSISALTTADPGKAREMCVQLAGFLRRTLGMGEKASIPLAEELALTRSYLNIERVRFGTRLEVEEEVDEACGEYPVPPLLLQPLVENAIKHGIANLIDPGFVRIRAQWIAAANGHPGTMQIVVENSFDCEGPSSRQTGGFGLATVRKRLQAHYGPGAALHASSEMGVYRVEMSLPAAS
jgi:two-component system, LytTR family, sensor histidine kinase AlgZ